jgi:BirA family biotin operon repressor/biotin-[acetyl-CoA-carboxylase] ligase
MFKSTKYPVEIIELAEIDSTNLYCKSIANKAPNREKVVLAHFQHTGKGQFGNTWESNRSENLTFSLLFYPKNIPATQFFQINQIISLGVIQGIKIYFSKLLPNRMAALDEHLRVKWPNDIYLNGKKIAGILIENSISGNQIEQSIAGIGLNVNQLIFGPALPNASSLQQFFNIPFDRKLLFDELIAAIFNIIHFPAANMAKTYEQFLYNAQLPALYRSGDSLFHGIIQGIDEYGRLIVLNIDETPPCERTFNHKEIDFAPIVDHP